MATGRSRFDIVVVKLCPFNMVRLTPVVIILSTGSEVCGFKPSRGQCIFSELKILSMTYFGREVKPWVQCRRFTVRK